MPKYETTKAHPATWTGDAKYVTTSQDGKIKMFWGEPVPDNTRLATVAYPLVALTVNGSYLVTRGTCNYVPAIEEMRALDNGDKRKLEISDRIERAREELRKAQAELEALGS